MKSGNRKHAKLALVLSAASLASVVLSSCGKIPSLGGGAPIPLQGGMLEELGRPPLDSGTFSDVYQTTLKTACIQCHVPGGNAWSAGAHLDFTDQSTAFQTLTTSTVSGGSSVGICGGVKIVAAGNPQSSYLAGVLFQDYNTADFAGVGGCQPYTAHLQDQNLSASEKASILAWIQGGAQNN